MGLGERTSPFQISKEANPTSRLTEVNIRLTPSDRELALSTKVSNRKVIMNKPCTSPCFC